MKISGPLLVALLASFAAAACARDLLAPVFRPSNVNPYHHRKHHKGDPEDPSPVAYLLRRMENQVCLKDKP
jgi:hypothetical protein